MTVELSGENWFATYLEEHGYDPNDLKVQPTPIPEEHFRETWLVDRTIEQIDQAVVNGPGPRWALMGPCEIFHVGGGEGGMAYCLDQFGPALKLPWTRLVAPELTDELRNAMVDGSWT